MRGSRRWCFGTMSLVDSCKIGGGRHGAANLAGVAGNLSRLAFLPMRVAMETSREAATSSVAASAPSMPSAVSDSERIEIVLPDGMSLRFSALFEAA